MSDTHSTALDPCRCCAGILQSTPQSLHNLPGLSALVYRTGTHASFKASTLAALSTAGTAEKALGLTTRANDDPSIALLDAASVLLDVLTFYQERIANEGFLRTATERRSVLELARQIGYELNPGVAASTTSGVYAGKRGRRSQVGDHSQGGESAESARPGRKAADV